MTLPTGKLPVDLLRSILADIPRTDPRVRVGPDVGEDAAVIDVGGRSLVLSTDPVTFATDRIGSYAVHVNANDVAVMGARPAWFFAVVLLPEATATRTLAKTIMSDIRSACERLGVALCGGHTEITAGLPRPIVVGQMVGEVEPAALKRKTSVAVGDRVLLTRGIAIEGTALLARERRATLGHTVRPALLDRAARFLVDPGISVVSAALTAAATGDAVHAMHDPTEGGLAGGLYELVARAALGVRIVRDRIHVFPETEAMCAALDLDPLKLIASGALLIAVSPDGAGKAIEALKAKKISVADIGEVTPANEGLTLVDGKQTVTIEPPARDEIARALT